MPVRESEARWEGTLLEGSGVIKVGTGFHGGRCSFPSRFASALGTNPEELIGAAHAGCFSMALSAGLTEAGFPPEEIHTRAKVHLEKIETRYWITRIELDTEARVPGIGERIFQSEANKAIQRCPVSRALAGTKISQRSRLI